MRKANPERLLLLLTVLFLIIAAVSFAAFAAFDEPCAEVDKCSPTRPSEILWDSFSGRLISLAN